MVNVFAESVIASQTKMDLATLDHIVTFVRFVSNEFFFNYLSTDLP